MKATEKATLYGTRLSPFVEKCARALELKGIEFELVPPKGPQDLKKWNPATGKMPVLALDGDRIYDSSRILRRLDELVPEPALFSADPAIAHRQSFFEDWSDESLYWYSMAFRWAPENEKATVAQVSVLLPTLLRPLAGLSLQSGQFRLPGGDRGADFVRGILLDEMASGHGDLLLVRPRPAKIPRLADQNRARIRVDEKLRHVATR
jgi:glutathione S-transferase